MATLPRAPITTSRLDGGQDPYERPENAHADQYPTHETEHWYGNRHSPTSVAARQCFGEAAPAARKRDARNDDEQAGECNQRMNATG
jgi:hypothetical protein